MESVQRRARAVLDKYTNYAEVIVVCHGIVITSQVGTIDEMPYCVIFEHSF